MIRILRSNLSRLGKDKLFIISLITVSVISLINALNSGNECERMAALGYYGTDKFDIYYFNVLPFVPLFSAAVTSMSLGKEYSFNTFRSKLISGHSRSSVYGANLITGIIISLALTAICFIGGLPAVFMMPQSKAGTKWVLVYLATAVFLMCAYAAFYTFMGMLISSRSVSAVSALVFALFILLAGSLIYNRLCEQEMISGAEITLEGIVFTDPHPNPAYIGGRMREVMQTVLNILPSGQAILIANLEADRPAFYIVSSVCIVIISTFLGMEIFKRKDLK